MIIDSFDAGAAAFPDRVFVQGGVQMRYSEAADASHAVAAALVRDVQPGTHVAVLSPNHPMVLPAMLGVHAVIGIGEALITGAALAFIAATRKDLLDLRPDRAAALARRTSGTGNAGNAGATAPTGAVKP